MGGGGLGAGGDVFVAEGGDVFVAEGGTLLIDGGLLSLGAVSGGAGAMHGGAFGTGIFMQGTQDVNLAAPLDQTLVISGVIADQAGSGGMGTKAAPGSLVVDGPGTVELDAKNTFVGGITLRTGTLDLAVPGAAGAGTIVFVPEQDATLEFSLANAPSNELFNFVNGDSIVVTGFDATQAVRSGGEVHLSNQTQQLVLNLPFITDFHAFDATFGTVITTDTPACYLEGTRIATIKGEVAVEDLSIGDLVRIRNGKFRPVRWLGRRAYAGVFATADQNVFNRARYPRPETIWPIRVLAGAFGPHKPTRDLFLSPDHAVFVNHVLIPIKYVINGDTITQQPRAAVIYYHVELDQHDVLLAEGLPAESFLNTGDRSNFENGGPVVRLHPEFTARFQEAAGCAPLVITGPVLDAVRARLLRRARRTVGVREPAEYRDAGGGAVWR
jgi:hypothetical protein